MRIHHVAFRTHDLARLEAFYRKLDLQVVRRQDHAVWLAAGEAILMLEQSANDEPPIDASTKELVAFAANESLEAMRARLHAAGVAIEAETSFTLYFRDPDGRRVALSRFDLGPVHA
jgi:catechol 2,3-dioxygenase-like lactoylglutathione lyase family enzyme